MSESTYFVRIRGKVSGPYEIEGLRRLVRQGALSRIHELSADRVTWDRAGEYEDLFPQPAGQSVTPLDDSRPDLELVDQLPVSTLPSTGSTVETLAQYCYSQNGATVGPVSMTVLRALAQNGSVRATDLVWRENAETGVPAYELPALAQFFTTVDSRRSVSAAPGIPYAAAQRGRPSHNRVAQQVGFSVTAIGIFAAAVLLLSLLIPWAVVDGRPVWSWDLYRLHEMGSWAAMSTYLLLAGVLVSISTPLTSGTARGLVNLSISAVALMLLATALLSTGASGTTGIQILISTAMAALIGVSMFRTIAPDAVAGRVLTGIFSGLATIGLLTFAMLWSSQQNSLEGVPGSIIFGLVLALAGLLAALAAGILGFVGLKPAFSLDLNRATWATALAGLILPVIGVCIAVVGAANFAMDLFPPAARSDLANAQSARFVVLEIVLRIALIWSAILAMIGAGMYELLVGLHARSGTGH